MLFRGIIGNYWKNYAKHAHTVYGPNAALLKVTAGGTWTLSGYNVNKLFEKQQ